jgi:hypothetical protein
MAAAPLRLGRAWMIVVLTLGALALPATVPAVASRATVLRTYTVFEDGGLAPGLQVRATVPGSCWTQSLVESRPYSWRCLHGEYIRDPCFSPTPTSRFVVCPDAPWSSRVLVLRLTEPLPHWPAYKRTISASSWPWGIVTIGGRHCSTTSGSATGEVTGKQVTYVCVGGGLLAGYTRRHTRTWTIWYAPAFNSKHLTLVTIADAWLE